MRALTTLALGALALSAGAPAAARASAVSIEAPVSIATALDGASTLPVTEALTGVLRAAPPAFAGERRERQAGGEWAL